MLDLNHIFSYHAPTDVQMVHYKAIRQAALDFAKAIVDHTPAGEDQRAAVRKTSEAMFTANAAIARNGRLYTYGDLTFSS